MEATENYVRWDAQDIALMIYARYRSKTTKEIAALLGRTPAAVTQKLYELDHPESASEKMQSLISKGQVLEAQVRSGMFPEQRERWDKKIHQSDGISVSYVQPEPEVPTEISVEEEIVDQKEPTVAPEQPVEKPFFSVYINTDAVIAMIRAWKGA